MITFKIKKMWSRNGNFLGFFVRVFKDGVLVAGKKSCCLSEDEAVANAIKTIKG